MSKKHIKGAPLEGSKIAIAVLALVILLLAGFTLGLYLSGYRYLQMRYLLAPEGTEQTITFMGFVNKDGSIRKGRISGTDEKSGKVFQNEDGDYLIEYNNGDRYLGKMDGLQRSGIGVLEYAGGDRYEGGFFADRLHGEGTFTYASGDVYTGSFSSGKKSGEGHYVWLDETGALLAEYEGSFKNDKRDGYGVYTTADGTVYKGYFRADHREDSGAEVSILTENGTDRYYGGYKSDVRAGFGYYFYACGDVYVGEFANNKPHGTGTIYFAGGSSYKGRFENGNILKDEAELLPSATPPDPDDNPFTESDDPQKDPVTPDPEPSLSPDGASVLQSPEPSLEEVLPS